MSEMLVIWSPTVKYVNQSFASKEKVVPCFSIDKDYIKRYLNSLNSFYAFDILLTKNRHD